MQDWKLCFGLETDSPLLVTQIFFQFIERHYEQDMKNLLKQSFTTNRLLAESTAKLQFLLNCRSHDLIPEHIYNLYEHRIKNVTFFSKTCKNKFNNFNKYCLSKLLKLEIQDINFLNLNHYNFANKNNSQEIMTTGSKISPIHIYHQTSLI